MSREGRRLHISSDADHISRREFLRRGSLLVGGLSLGSAVLAACSGGSEHRNERPEEMKTPEIDVLRHGTWNTPGVKPDQGGLRVASIGYAIANENDNSYIDNPPVNLLGTHLETKGDFEISVDMHEIDGEAAITLYGRPPIIFDELRYETGSVRIAIEGDSLWVGVMDIDAQDYGDGYNFQITSSEKSARLTIKRAADQLIISLDGEEAGRVPARGTFDSGELWFGLDSGRDDNGWLLSKLTATPINGGKLETVDSSLAELSKDPNGLDALARKRRPDFRIGTAVSTAPLAADQRYAELALGGNFGIFTPENAMKWKFLHPQPGIYCFEEAKAFVALAKAHDIKIHGHTFDFAGALPAYLHEMAERQPNLLEGELVSHIQKVMTEFTDILDWDVVNELLADYDDTEPGKYGMRRNIWYEAMGPDHAIIALKAAHKANAKARLWINEYGMESDDDRFSDMLALVKRAITAGIPADKLGVGFQAHIDQSDTVDGRSIDKDKLRQRFQALDELGVKVRISELDIRSSELESVFADVVEVAIKAPNCTDVVMWGITDKYGAGNTISGGQIQPYASRLWDRNAEPTPAVTRLYQVLA